MKKEKEIILRALGLFVRETKASIFIQEGTREPKKEAIVCYIKKKNHTYSIDFPAFRHLEKEKQEALLTILSIKEDAEEIIQKDNPPMYVLKGDLVRGSHYVMKNKKSISGYSMETPYIQDLYEMTDFHFTKEEAEAYCLKNKQMTAYSIEKLRTFDWFQEGLNRGGTQTYLTLASLI